VYLFTVLKKKLLANGPDEQLIIIIKDIQFNANIALHV